MYLIIKWKKWNKNLGKFKNLLEFFGKINGKYYVLK